MKSIFKTMVIVITALMLTAAAAPCASMADAVNGKAVKVKKITKVTVGSIGLMETVLTIKTGKTGVLTGFYAYYNGKAAYRREYKYIGTLKESVRVPLPYGKKQQVTIVPFYKDGNTGRVIKGKAGNPITVKSKKVGISSVKVTKIRGSKVRLTVKKASKADGVVIQCYKGRRWRTIKKTKKPAAVIKARKAAKLKYRVKSYVTDKFTGRVKVHYTAACKARKAGVNVYRWSYSHSIRSYKKYYHYFRPVKIKYSKGKAVFRCMFINRHGYRMNNIKVRAKITCQGRTLGTKVIQSGPLSANSVKTKTVVLNTKKKGLDLRNGGTGWEHEIISAVDFENENVKN